MLKRMLTWCQGRHTMFALYFAIMGTIMQWYHHLDSNFIMLIGAIQAFVLGHSIKEDYYQEKSQASASTVAPEDAPIAKNGAPDPRGGA